MAPRKQMRKQAATKSNMVVADEHETPPKKRKTERRSTLVVVPTQIETMLPRQLKRMKKDRTATEFSPMKLRSTEKKVVTENDANSTKRENISKMPVNKRKGKKTAVGNHDTGEKMIERVVEEKGRVNGKTTANPKSKVPIAKKGRNKIVKIENGKDAENGTVNGVHPLMVHPSASLPSKSTRRGRTVDEENVATTKVQSIKKSKKRESPETEMIAGDETEERNDAEMIVASKKSRGRTKKTDTETVKKTIKKEKSEDEPKINKKNSNKRNKEKTISKEKYSEDTIDKNNDETTDKMIALKSLNENVAMNISLDESNDILKEENNKIASITGTIEDAQIIVNTRKHNLERSPSLVSC